MERAVPITPIRHMDTVQLTKHRDALRKELAVVEYELAVRQLPPEREEPKKDD